ncbi:MAG: thiamine phosphate synthase [Rickettsiales bacterium]
MTPSKGLPLFLYMSETRAGKPSPERVILSLSGDVGVVIREYGPDRNARQKRVDSLVRACEDKGVSYLVALQREEDARKILPDSPLFLGFHLPKHARVFALSAKETIFDRTLTCSVHDEGDAREAAAFPLQAVVVSPFFAVSHKNAGAPLGAKGFRRLRDLSGKPAFALGGVTRDNWSEVVREGACGVAGVSFFYSECSTKS